MNAREAVFGFAAWLTCRPLSLKVGAKEPAAKMAELADLWAEHNKLPPVSRAYPNNIKQPRLK